METFQRVGEVGFVSAVASLHTVADGSGFYNGHHYDWDRLISPAYRTTTSFDTLASY